LITCPGVDHTVQGIDKREVPYSGWYSRGGTLPDTRHQFKFQDVWSTLDAGPSGGRVPDGRHRILDVATGYCILARWHRSTRRPPKRALLFPSCRVVRCDTSPQAWPPVIALEIEGLTRLTPPPAARSEPTTQQQQTKTFQYAVRRTRCAPRTACRLRALRRAFYVCILPGIFFHIVDA